MNTREYPSRRIITAAFIVLTMNFVPDAIAEKPKESKEYGVPDSAPNHKQRTVPFITLRNKTGSDKASGYFGGGRDVLRTGHCEMSHLPLTGLKAFADGASFYVPEEIVKLDTISLSPVDDFWSEKANTLDGRYPVLYAHGFFVSFERGCRRASLLQELLGINGRLVLFSWPSDGAMLNYTRDESDLFWSVDPLQHTLRDMIDRFGAGKIDLVAHSLGTRGIMLALVRLAQVEREDGPLVNQVILVAPDIDAGIFRQYLPIVRSLAKNITVYVSSKDSALVASRKLHGYPRLGEAGPHLEGLTGIDIIDMSDIPVRYPSGHVYHLYHDVAVADLRALLNENKPASQRSNLKQTAENTWSLQLPEKGRQQSGR